MRNVVFTICLFAISSICFAQESHMKFMGISMGNNIEVFTNSLKNKGFSVDPISKELSTGSRLMKGKFCGEDVEVIIGYSIYTKKIKYCGTIFDKSMSSSRISSLYSELHDLLLEKYTYTDKSEMIEDSEHWPKLDLTTKQGTILLKVYQSGSGDEYIRHLQLVYYDGINCKEDQEKSNSSKMDDL